MAEEKDGGDKRRGGNNGVSKNCSKSIVLKIDFHCGGCASKIVKCAKAFEGVESVRVEWEASRLTVEGKVDPTKLRERLQTKTKKKVELVSPQPIAGKDRKDINTTTTTNYNNSDISKIIGMKADDKRPKELPMTTAVLKLGLHCNGCVQKIHKLVSKTPGVNSVTIENQKDLVTVTGRIDVKALVAALKGRVKREVEILPLKKEKEKGNNNEEKKADSAGGKGGENGGGKAKANCGNAGGGIIKEEPNFGRMLEGSRMEHLGTVEHPANAGYGFGCKYGQWHSYEENVHAPQYFSDENPNACSVM